MLSIQKMQKAIYAIIEAQSTGELANINGVFHYIPQNTNFPYVHIGEGHATDISDFKNKVFKIAIKIYVFDKSESNLTVMTLCDEIKDLLLDISNLTVDNHTLLDSKLAGCNVTLQNDGNTWKGEMGFEFAVRKS